MRHMWDYKRLLMMIQKRFLGLDKILFFLLLVIGHDAIFAPTIAMAEQVPPSLADDITPGALDAWVKICILDASQKKICQTSYDLHATTGQVVASFAIIEMDDDDRKIVRIAVPTGLLLQKGAPLIIDNKQYGAAQFVFCTPWACVAQMPVVESMINALRNGNQMVIRVYKDASKPIVYQFPLLGFSKSNDGKPLTQDAIKQRSAALQRIAKKRQEDIEKRLKEAQQQLMKRE